MKQLLLLSTFLFLALQGSAQISVTATTLPVLGDTLIMATDNLPSNINIGSVGGSQIWDFSGLQAPYNISTAFKRPSKGAYYNQFPSADLISTLPGNKEIYYNKTNRQLQVLGMYGPDPLNIGIDLISRFEPPIVERRGPIKYNKSFNAESNLVAEFSADDIPGQWLDSLPISPDSLRIRIDFDRIEKADAYGDMIIPGGNTYEVLRVKRTDIQQGRLYAKLPFVDWVDITNLLPNNDKLRLRKEVSYHFLSNESKEPIAVVYTSGNRRVTRVDYKVPRKALSKSTFLDMRSPAVFVFPNPAIEDVRFEFNNLLPGFYELKIYNILGVPVWEERYWIPGNRTEKVSLSNLTKGTYLYSLIDGTGNTISTKRLMIVRP